MKKIAGWVILLAVLGGLVALTAIAKGWVVAASVWGFTVVVTTLLVLAVCWISD